MQFRKAVVSLITLSAFAAGACLPVNAQASKDYNTAARLFSHHQIADALVAVNRVIQSSPNFGPAYALRADIYCAQDKNKLAIQDIAKAVSIEGADKNPDYYEVAARAHYQSGDPKGAIEALSHAIKIDPTGDVYWRMRSKMWTILKDEKKALSDINSAIKVQSGKSIANWKVRGDIYMQQGKYDLAAADYTSAIQRIAKGKDRDVDSEKLYSIRALAYQKLGRKDLAAKDTAKVQSVVKDGWGAFLYDQGKKD